MNDNYISVSEHRKLVSKMQDECEEALEKTFEEAYQAVNEINKSREAEKAQYTCLAHRLADLQDSKSRYFANYERQLDALTKEFIECALPHRKIVNTVPNMGDSMYGMVNKPDAEKLTAKKSLKNHNPCGTSEQMPQCSYVGQVMPEAQYQRPEYLKAGALNDMPIEMYGEPNVMADEPEDGTNCCNVEHNESAYAGMKKPVSHQHPKGQGYYNEIKSVDALSNYGSVITTKNFFYDGADKSCSSD